MTETSTTAGEPGGQPTTKRYRLKVSGGLRLEVIVAPDLTTITLFELGSPAVVITVDLTGEPSLSVEGEDGALHTQRHLRSAEDEL
jgi:hypothetical protein